MSLCGGVDCLFESKIKDANMEIIIAIIFEVSQEREVAVSSRDCKEC
jgi:hypothetical protein